MSDLIKNVTKGNLLGHGTFASVYLATDKRNGEQYALKVLAETIDDAAVAMVNGEAELLKNLDHTNLVK